MEKTASQSGQFEEALNLELPVLFRVAKRLTQNLQEAEDLVSQTVFKAFRSQTDFDGRFLRSWLIRILRNEFSMACRSQKMHPKVVSVDQALSEPNDAGKSVVDSDLRIDLFAALDALPEEYRIPIALCDVEELSYEEAAKTLDMPVGTLRSRLHRGRRLMRQILMKGEK